MKKIIFLIGFIVAVNFCSGQELIIINSSTEDVSIQLRQQDGLNYNLMLTAKSDSCQVFPTIIYPNPKQSVYAQITTRGAKIVTKIEPNGTLEISDELLESKH